MTMRIGAAALASALIAGAGIAQAQTTTTTTQSAPLHRVTTPQSSEHKAARARVKHILSTHAVSMAPQRAVARTPVRSTTRVVKTTARPPLDLSPAQRRSVYSTVIDETIAPAPVVAPTTIVTAPAPTYVVPPAPTYVAPAPTYVAPAPTYTVPAPVVTEEVVAPPPAVVTVPTTTGAAVVEAPPPPPTTTVTYRIGGPVPSGLQVYGFPPEAIASAPALRAYGYAQLGDRVLLVDPRTHVVVDELYPGAIRER